MAVTEGCARPDGDVRRLTLVTPRWNADMVAFADNTIDRFFADLRRTYVDDGEGGFSD
jgi:hypothetical protein